MTRLWLALPLLLTGVQALAQDASEPEAFARAERARIEVQRQQVRERYAGEERACAAKFAVNDCLRDAKAKQREALADLHRQETSLNDAERRRKGARQLERTEARLREDVPTAPTGAASGAVADRASRRVQDKVQTESQRRVTTQERADELAQKKQRNAQKEAARAAQAAAAADAQRRYQVKREQAAQHKADLQKRREQSTKQPARPLPVPE